MPFLYSTIFQTWNTTFQLSWADSFTHGKLRSKSLLLCTLESLIAVLREQRNPPPFIVLIPPHSAPERQENWDSCSITCNGKLSGKAHSPTVWETSSCDCSVKMMLQFSIYQLLGCSDVFYFSPPLINAVWRRLKLHTSEPTKELLQSPLMCAILKKLVSLPFTRLILNQNLVLGKRISYTRHFHPSWLDKSHKKKKKNMLGPISNRTGSHTSDQSKEDTSMETTIF